MPTLNKIHHHCLSMLTWIGFNSISIFWTANIHLLRYDTAVLTISAVSPPVDHTQLHFLRHPVVVSSSPSPPSRRLRLHLRLGVFAVFVYAIASSPASLSPFTLRIHRGSSLWDRPQWPTPKGALGNAPVGTSLCRCGGGFLRVCIPCNGFRHRVSPDLSSDKSHLVRDP
ncbi:hypothetical protein OUZ56_004218 [Daphnia magna]|uniref:Uncharacterized protein n=1 Tax=Daphnia magna TaxID=35525 RepID=A0ABQ9YP49_9CRUS|nr:hypothetical protein OUZ56_004218 [Daphnia magna]